MKVEVFFDGKIKPKDYPEIDLAKLRKGVLIVDKKESLPENINLIFTDNFKIKELNKVYRGKNKPTDVLSFNYSEGNYEFIEQKDETGEVYVSLEFLKEHSQKKGLNFNYSIYRAVFHGILHLAGYDHKLDDDYEKMMQKEENLIEEIESL